MRFNSLVVCLAFAVIPLIAYAEECSYPKLMVEKTPNKMTIYKHFQGNQYVGYPIYHRVKQYNENEYPSNLDNWGILYPFLAKRVESGMTSLTTLFLGGEAELAINVPDSRNASVNAYVGGSAHGFEKIVVEENDRKMVFLIDNQEYGENDVISLKECKSVKVVQNSLLYQAYSDSNPFANVAKQWTISDVEKLRISTSVKLLRNISIKQAQFGMFCVYRHLDGNTSKPYLTNKAIKNSDRFEIYTVEDGWENLTEHPENAGLRNKTHDCTQITEYGECGVEFSLTIIDSTIKSNGGMFVGTNGNAYNKIYFDLTGQYNAMAGETLSAIQEWNITGSFNFSTITYLIDNEVYKIEQYKHGDQIIPIKEPEKIGYIFSGWSWIPSKMPTEDVIVTGTFKKEQRIGDINGDGKINTADLVKLIELIMAE